MKVICKKSTARLVKGGIYEVNRLIAGSSINRPYLLLKGFGRHSINSFSNMDGTPIERKDWTSPDYNTVSEEIKNTNISDVRVLKKGDLVVCRHQFSKYIDLNKIYKIAEIKYEEKMIAGTWSINHKLRNQSLKIEGYNKWLSPYRFRLCTTQEKRTISLSGLLGDQTGITSVEMKSRRIDRIYGLEKDKIILSTLFSAIVDPSRNNATIIEWAAKKGKRNYDINEKDFEPFSKLKISDIINIFEKNT